MWLPCGVTGCKGPGARPAWMAVPQARPSLPPLALRARSCPADSPLTLCLRPVFPASFSATLQMAGEACRSQDRAYEALSHRRTLGTPRHSPQCPVYLCAAWWESLIDICLCRLEPGGQGWAWGLLLAISLVLSRSVLSREIDE